MSGEMITIAMADGFALPCYRAAPVGERRGGLVLVQEIFGVTEHIREECDSYAAEGYEVLSPALFERVEPGCALGYTGADWERAVKIARELQPFAQSLSDTAGVLDWLKAKGGPLFIMGYCYGGSVAWRMAQTYAGLDAASSFYGGFVATRFGDDAPKCATIAHFGRYDPMVEFAPVEALIAKAHATAQIFVYEAGHGFNSDRRKDYHRESAALARARTLGLFKALGG